MAAGQTFMAQEKCTRLAAPGRCMAIVVPLPSHIKMGRLGWCLVELAATQEYISEEIIGARVGVLGPGDLRAWLLAVATATNIR